jgi:hypothetical protein
VIVHNEPGTSITLHPGTGSSLAALIHQVSRGPLESELCIETPPAKRVAAAFAELAHAI